MKSILAFYLIKNQENKTHCFLLPSISYIHHHSIYKFKTMSLETNSYSVQLFLDIPHSDSFTDDAETPTLNSISNAWLKYNFRKCISVLAANINLLPLLYFQAYKNKRKTENYSYVKHYWWYINISNDSQGGLQS